MSLELDILIYWDAPVYMHMCTALIDYWPFLIIGGGLVTLNVYGGYGPAFICRGCFVKLLLALQTS